MHDVSFSVSKTATVASWMLMVVSFLTSVWLFAHGQHDLAIMLGIKSVLWAAIAGVLTVRGMAIRMCNLIRATADRGDERSDLRAVR